jgi:hypothetical protein
MFSSFDDAGRLTPLTVSGLAAGIKELVGLGWFGPCPQYAAHSLRRGGASGALVSGMLLFLTKFQGDWRSECDMRYLTVTKSDMVAITGTKLHLDTASFVLLRCLHVVSCRWSSLGVGTVRCVDSISVHLFTVVFPCICCAVDCALVAAQAIGHDFTCARGCVNIIDIFEARWWLSQLEPPGAATTVSQLRVRSCRVVKRAMYLP